MAKLLARFPKSSNKTWLMGSWIRQCTLFKFANYYCQVTINFTGQVLAVIGRALRGPVVGATSSVSFLNETTDVCESSLIYEKIYEHFP